MKQYNIGIDIGGSHIVAALVNLHNGEIDADSIRSVDLNGDVNISTFLSRLTGILQSYDTKSVANIGVAIPGPFNYEKGIFKISGAKKFNHLFGLNLKQALRMHLNGLSKNLSFENDASCYALGEYRAGAAKGSRRSLIITLGTGLGSTFLIDGKIQQDAGDEIPLNGYLYNIPFRESIGDDYFSTRWFVNTWEKMTGEKLSGVKEIVQSSRNHSQVFALFEEFSKNLAEFLHPWLKLFKPDTLVIGGSIAKASSLFMDKLAASLEEKSIEKVNISTCKLWNNAPLIGAAMNIKLSSQNRTAEEKEFRKTEQFPAPPQAKSAPQGRYDIYPGFPLGSGKIKNGHETLSAWIIRHKTVVIDGYAGVLWDSFVETITNDIIRQKKTVRWFHSDAAMKSPEEINRMLTPYLGDQDSIFGKITDKELIDWFDQSKLQSIKPDTSADINILVGCGAALAAWEAPLIYVDLPKNELQFRMRAGVALNLGADKPADFREMYKRSYFVDWQVLNKHKATVLQAIEVIVDEQRPDNYLWMSGEDLRKGLTVMSSNFFRVRPWFEPGIWGGNWMKEHIDGLNKQVDNLAWSFELMTLENGLMFESDDYRLEVSFDFLMYNNYKEVLGNCAERFKYDFPIRFDFLDTFDGGNLSIQCHPHTDYIREEFGMPFTQDEAYYILDCKEEAGVYLGFQEGINSGEFHEELLESEKGAKKMNIEKYVQRFPAHKHDFFLIPNGTIHASGTNNLVLEISSAPYFFTFKMYDWDRVDLDGRPRPINIEHGMKNVDFDRQGKTVAAELISKPYIMETSPDYVLEHLPTHPLHFYDVHRYIFDNEILQETNDNCHVWMLVEGTSIMLETENGMQQRFNYAETFVVPANARSYKITNLGKRKALMLKAFIKLKLFLLCVALSCTSDLFPQLSSVWKIGEKDDDSSAEFALGPSDYEKFLENDFGYENGYFLVGKSVLKKDFPYVLPGPADMWAGTSGTAGWRTHEINILFGIESAIPENAEFRLYIDLIDANFRGSLLKVSINDTQIKKFTLGGSGSDLSITGTVPESTRQRLIVVADENVLKKGGNKINLTILEGSWIVFNSIELKSNKTITIQSPDKVFIRDVKACSYELVENGKNYQPLLVDLEHLHGRPLMQVKLDGQAVFSAVIDTCRYQFEVPMPAVHAPVTGEYEILIDGIPVAEGRVNRSPQKIQTSADYVNTMMGAAHSRWMIAPGPWMPFSMVKLSPDNQNHSWQAGYQPSFENIGCFSHIHEWTMAGLGMMPTNGPLEIKVGDESNPDSGYRSRIDKLREEAPIGYYKVYLTDTDIEVALTANVRSGFQRYTFPTDKDGRVMIDLHIPSEYDYELVDVEMRKVTDYRIEGYSRQKSSRPHVWGADADQEYTVNFVIEFDRSIKRVGGWINNEVRNTALISGKNLQDAGMYVEFDTQSHPVVQVRSGISMVSISNASENLEKEITQPFGWDYAAVVSHQRDVWNELLSRLTITSSNRMEKVRFYTNMYRALCSRNSWSDTNGEWRAADLSKQQLSNPEHRALGCDAFWNTFWNLNQFWNLVTPEWSSRWVNSQLAMYDVNGWLAKGPAGMKYIPVMVAEHEIPMIVGAYQMGIRDFDAQKALSAMKKMQTTPGAPVANGYAGNSDLAAYLQYHYVPSDKGTFSNTLEYSYDDWTVAQFAKALGEETDYRLFAERGEWWRNAINPANGYAQMRESNGKFVTPFDPFKSGAHHHYVEGNAWQLSYFVPQNVSGLIDMVGSEKFLERLEWGFKESEIWRYNAPGDQYWDYPVVQGNQQSMHFSFLFNWAGAPWQTQRWSRSVIDNYYGFGTADAYLGDEDQGQMSAWFIMAAIGLFQTDGGCRVEPIYEITAPLFEKTVINLGEKYGRGTTFTIEAGNVSRKNKYIQSATLNGEPLHSFNFPAKELLKGGSLVLNMGDEPNKNAFVHTSIPDNPAPATSSLIYPNPTTGQGHIQAGNSTVKSVKIFDAFGMLREQFNNNSFDISYFPNGIYFFEVNTESSTFVTKLIKGNE